MTGDAWTLIISGAVVALITYALPPLIKSVFDRRVSVTSAEVIQESIEKMRWDKTHDYIKELEHEIKRLRKILIKHQIDPNEDDPLSTQPIEQKK
jgi:predicted nucleic acid-binding protein